MRYQVTLIQMSPVWQDPDVSLHEKCTEFRWDYVVSSEHVRRSLNVHVSIILTCFLCIKWNDAF